MSIKQTITYNSNNKYFAGFLNNILNESKLEGSVKQENNKIILIIDDKDEKKLEKFSKITSKYLPHSIYLGDIQTSKVEEKAYKVPFKSPSYDIALCPRCLEDLTRPSSDTYLDDRVKCNHYSNESIEQMQDLTLYTPHYSNCCSLLLCNSSKVDDLFIMTDDEKMALFSIEKPSIKVTIKDENLKQMTGKNYIYVKSPHNVKSSLAALNAEDSEIDYLFFEDINETKAVVVQKNISLIKDNRVTNKLINFDKNSDLNRFLNIAHEMGNKNNAIGANLSMKNGISFMVSNDVSYKKVITFDEFNLEQLLINMENDDAKGKLLNNFALKYSNIIQKLEENNNYNLFETLAVILEIDDISFNGVCDKSLEFRGNGGLKIDMNFVKGGFDYLSFFGSIMSFKLADTDSNYLAYSIFEAYADMAISTLNQLKKEFDIDNFIMMGDLFENSILYSRILSKFNMSNPFFSKLYALDD